jgi:hypothetical protein
MYAVSSSSSAPRSTSLRLLLLTVLLLDARLWTLPLPLPNVSRVTPCWLVGVGVGRIEYDTESFLLSSTMLEDFKVLRKTFQLPFFFTFSPFLFFFRLIVKFIVVDGFNSVGFWLTGVVLKTTEQYRLQSESEFLCSLGEVTLFKP